MSTLTSNSSNDPLRLDEPLSEAQLAHIMKWYEDEVSDPEHAATHDCHVVRAFRELLRLKRPTIETEAQLCPTCGGHYFPEKGGAACPSEKAKVVLPTCAHGATSEEVCPECMGLPSDNPDEEIS